MSYKREWRFLTGRKRFIIQGPGRLEFRTEGTLEPKDQTPILKYLIQKQELVLTALSQAHKRHCQHNMTSKRVAHHESQNNRDILLA